MAKQIETMDGYGVLVDDQDFDLNQYVWFVNSKGYVVKSGDYTPRLERMHRIILSRMLGRPLARHEFPDHIDGNTLDNRRENLRLATNAQNAFNRGRNKNHKNPGGFKGVYPTKSARRPWMAKITVDRKQLYLGSFRTAVEAARAYDRKALEVAGVFAKGNFT